MLSYAFLRERIINNNTLDTYEVDSKFKNDLDSLYNQKSQDVENQILLLQNSYPSILQPIISLTSLTDSSNFCS